VFSSEIKLSGFFSCKAKKGCSFSTSLSIREVGVGPNSFDISDWELAVDVDFT
jgi:hypothetical protein